LPRDADLGSDPNWNRVWNAMPDDNAPISATDAKRLFADWRSAPAIVLAVSGGPDRVRATL
jgi:hypothetical protein